jgi:hypothetical protein
VPVFVRYFLQRVAEHIKHTGIDACPKVKDTEERLRGSSWWKRE